jgi:hypothetical protein
VNYAFRFGGPVTTSPPAVPGMVSESPNLPARCSARYKCSLVPRRFSLQLPHSFSPRPVQLGSSCLGELHQRSNHPEVLWGPTNSYDRANEKNGLARPYACVRFVPRNTLSFRCSNLAAHSLTLDPTFLADVLALTVTSMACLAFPVAGCPLVRWP